MEKIVYYLDGQTLLHFKTLSKLCYDIVNNVLRHNTLWKNICLKEIPYKYIIDIISKQFDGYVKFESITEIQYERLYKTWLIWQRTTFNTKNIGNLNYLGLQGINKILCNKVDITVIFSKYVRKYSIIKSEKNSDKYVIVEKQFEYTIPPFTLFMLNPRPQAITEDDELNLYTTYHLKNRNICPLHNTSVNVHDGNNGGFYMGNLLDVDTNVYINACCMVREKWYEWHSNVESRVINGHNCYKLDSTYYTSVLYGVMFGTVSFSKIVIHDIYKDTCITISSWLDRKYIRATAVYIYTNILFVGTHNGYLLVYRLKCWDDLIDLKNENMLLETQLKIGYITGINLMDFGDTKAIVVCSMSSISLIQLF